MFKAGDSRAGAPRWTSVEDSILLSMQRGGASASKIVEALSATGFTVTRSAVLGRIFRLRKRLDGPAPAVPKPVPKATKAPKPEPAPEPTPAPLPAAPATPVTGSALGFYDPWPRRACRFPIFAERVDPDAPVFCGGAVTRIGSPYCDHHHPIVYHPQPKRAFVARKGRLT